MVEIDATAFFANESVDWKYCHHHAPFVHKEACEFILHIGNRDESESGDQAFYVLELERMREFGCSKAFMKAYKQAALLGAVRVLFYA